MEAKDTVMTERQLAKLFPATGKQIREAQAEVSFKAGYEEAVKVLRKHPGVVAIVDEALKEEKQAGRKEVVEFTFLFNRDITLNQMRATNLYQKQMEEWGIDAD